MIAGIYQIGEIICGNYEPVAGFSASIFDIKNRIDKGKKIVEILLERVERSPENIYLVGVITFNLKDDVVEVEVTKTYDEKKAKRFKFVSLEFSGKENRFLCTFTDPKRFLGKKEKKYSCWLSIEDELKKLEEELKKYNNTLPSGTLRPKFTSQLSLFDWLSYSRILQEISVFLRKLEEITERFYENYILDLTKLRRINHTVIDSTEVRESLRSGKNSSAIFEELIKREINTEKERVAFWTIKIVDNDMDQYVVDYDFYNLLLEHKVIESRKKKNRSGIVCHLCRRTVNTYFDNYKYFPVKIFINDKWGFSQSLSNEWFGNFALCERCYLCVLAGMKFVYDRFILRINSVIDVLTVPELMFFGGRENLVLSEEKLMEWARYIKVIYNPFTFFDKQKIRDMLDAYKRHGFLQNFVFNYVFHKENNKQFKVYSIVREITPGRIDELRDALMLCIEKFLSSVFPTHSYSGRSSLSMDKLLMLRSLGDIINLIPLEVREDENNRKEVADKSKLTNLFSSILNGSMLKKELLIREFWIKLRAIYFGDKSYYGINAHSNFRKREKEICIYLLNTHLFIMLLKQLLLLEERISEKLKNQEREGSMVVLGSFNIPEDFVKYISTVGFNEKEASLFLLGTLVSDIAASQIEYGSKPVLEKINFSGMSVERLKVLFNEIYEKLYHEKLLYPEQECVYAAAKYLFDSNLRTWDLKPYENVYYILSGYAYRTLLRISAKKKQDKGSKKNTTNPE